MPVPRPPPQHIVTSPISLSERSSSCSSVVISRAPVEPSGWPSAIAPPLTLTRSMSGLELALPGGDDRRERLVDLEQVDVVDRHPVALEELPRRRDRAGEHDHRVDADRRLVDDPRARREPELLGLLARHQQHRGRAVGDLRRVARGDLAVLLERRLELPRAPRGVVSGRMPWSVDVRVAVDLDRDDLALEAALLGRLVRRAGASARPSSSSSERGISHWSAIISALRALRRQVVAAPAARAGTARRTRRRLRCRRRHRDVAHVLDARADHDVVDAGGDQRGGEVDRLLGRAALAVDRRRRASRSAARPAARRCAPMLNDCSPNCCTQPATTSSTSAASMPGALDDLGVGLRRAARWGGCPCSSPSPGARARSACAPPRRSRPRGPCS